LKGFEIVAIAVAATIEELPARSCLRIKEESRKSRTAWADCHWLTAHRIQGTGVTGGEQNGYADDGFHDLLLILWNTMILIFFSVVGFCTTFSYQSIKKL
jgi:hypothetical protein